jgi:hypothetical protein
MEYSLMVVETLDVLGTVGGPSEAKAILVVDADRMLPGSIADQTFEVVRGRSPQSLQTHRRV